MQRIKKNGYMILFNVYNFLDELLIHGIPLQKQIGKPFIELPGADR